MHIETEIKFSLDADGPRKILSSRLVKRASERKPRTKSLRSTYYETRQHLLRKSGLALRLREFDGKFEQTIKIPVEGSVGMLNFEEWTVPLERSRPDLALFDAAVTARFNPRNRALKLLPVFTTDIERTTILLEYSGSQFELALDRGRIVGHGRAVRAEEICELELELVQGGPEGMLDFALALNESCDFFPEHRTKAQRGYALARLSLKPRPAKAKHVLLDSRMSVGQAFQKIATDALLQLYANEVLVIDGASGGIHQARVAMRRMRAALRAFKAVLPYDKRKAFNGEFRWFQHRLSRARDWHVFLSETLPRIQAGRPNARVSLGRLRKLAIAERRRATREATELFKSKRYTRLLLQFQRWLMSLDQNNPKLSVDVTGFAKAVLNRSRRHFLLDTRPLSRMTMEEIHDLRKRGKKARYATEFFADLWPEDRSRDDLRTMARIQDLLGKVNDASVARQVLAGVPARALKPSSVALVQSWSDERSRQCVKAAQPVWREFQKTTPFWAG